MKNILEPTYQRQINLLEYLLLEQEKISLYELSIKTNSSESTVLRDINFFNEKFKNRINIKKNYLKKIELEDISFHNVKYIQHSILNNSPNIQILLNILEKPFQTANFYSNLLDFSPSSIYKSIKDINHSLENYQIEIKNIRGKYFIEAKSEIVLRKLLSIFWVETHLYNLKDSISEQNEIDYILKKNTPDLLVTNQFIQPYYLSFLFISLIREKNNFPLDDDFVSHSQSSDVRLIEQIEKSFLYSPFTDNKFFYNRSFYELIDFIKKDLFNTHSNEEVKPLFDMLKKIYENEISHQIPIKLFISQLGYFDSNLKKDAYIYKDINNIISEIENILKIDLTEYEPLLRYLLIVYYPDTIKNFSTRDNRVYVHSYLSETHANFMSYQLNNYFNHYYDFQVISKSELNHLPSSSIIVTNDHLLTTYESIVVNDYINKINLKQIEDRLLKT